MRAESMAEGLGKRRKSFGLEPSAKSYQLYIGGSRKRSSHSNVARIISLSIINLHSVSKCLRPFLHCEE